MKEKDDYYPYYEKLMRMAPLMAVEETPEYKALATGCPCLSKSIELQKKLERLRGELRSAKGSTRLHIRSQMKSLVRQLERQDLLKRLRGESKLETNYKRRFAIATLRRQLLSIAKRVRNAYSELENRVEERSRMARLSRVSKLPPSLFDLRSLDPADRGLALREWIEKRGSRIRVQRPASPVEATGPSDS